MYMCMKWGSLPDYVKPLSAFASQEVTSEEFHLPILHIRVYNSMYMRVYEDNQYSCNVLIVCTCTNAYVRVQEKVHDGV